MTATNPANSRAAAAVAAAEATGVAIAVEAIPAEVEVVEARSATSAAKSVISLVHALRPVAIATVASAADMAVDVAVEATAPVEVKVVDRPATPAVGMVTIARTAPKAVARSATTVARLVTSPASAHLLNPKSASATAASSQDTSRLNARTRRSTLDKLEGDKAIFIFHLQSLPHHDLGQSLDSSLRRNWHAPQFPRIRTLSKPWTEI